MLDSFTEPASTPCRISTECLNPDVPREVSGKRTIRNSDCHIFTKITGCIKDTRLESQQSVVAEPYTATRHNSDFVKTGDIVSISSYNSCIIREALSRNIQTSLYLPL
jgi:hypothetical protein